MRGRPRLVTDDEIFDAITRVVTEHGPAGATLDRIANTLGLTGPALANRFGNKRQLFLAFAKRQPGSVKELIAAQRTMHDDPIEAVIGFYIALVSAMTTKIEVANNLAMLNLDLTDPDLGEQAKLQARAIRRGTTALLREAGLDDAAAVARDLHTVWSGAILTWAIDGRGSLETWLRRHLERALAAHR